MRRLFSLKLLTPQNSPSSKTIGTHSGSFHCDEVLACYMLRSHTNTFRDAKILRSRDPSILSQCDIIVDVGAEFNPAQNRFDHHQSSFNETFSPAHATKLSSAGLIYKYFGAEIILDILTSDTTKSITTHTPSPALSADVISLIHCKVYESLIEGVDGIDNGIAQFESDSAQRYQVHTDLGGRIGALNPWWNEPQSDDIAMAKFEEAMVLAGEALRDCVVYIYKGWLPAREMVL